MAINHLVARKYASAAFNVAKNLNLLDQFFIDLNKFSNAVSNSVIKELSSPAISRNNLSNTIVEMGNKLSLNNKVIDFLAVIAGARRLNMIKSINKNFSHLFKKEKNILEAEVFSVNNLSDEEIKSVKSILENKYNSASVDIKQTIKKDILGGVIIRVGSVMIDSSLKNQLVNLESQLQSNL